MDKKKKNKNTKRLLKYAFKNKPVVFVVFLFALFSNSLAISAPFVIGKAVDIMVKSGVDFSMLLNLCALLAIIYAFSSLFNYLAQLLSYYLSVKAVERLRKDVFIHLSKMKLNFYDTTPHGEVIQRLTSDMDYISEGLFQLITQLFGGCVAIVGSMIFMLILSWQIALVVILFTPLCFVLVRLITKNSSRYFKKQSALAGQLSGYLEEMVAGQKIIRAFNYEDKSFDKYFKINAELYQSGYKSQFFSAMINPGIRLLNNIIYIFIGVFGGILAISGKISIGTISSFLSYSIQFSQPINNITAVSTQLQYAMASANRVFNILDNELETPDNINAVTKLPGKKSVDFNNITFSYSKNTKLIENFSLNVKTGMKVAIVGPTGSGKTTLVNLLMRFYEVQDGNIEVCKIDTKDIARSTLRSAFAMVLQETWLKSGTILDNIIYGNKAAGKQQIENVLALSGCDTFINKLPQGLNTIISENGTISQGQKQLLTIARAMLNLPDMLILDEATSSVDILTEQKIASAFDKMMVGRTSFIIAHRLSTIKNCDIILVLHKGNIVEQGTHSELLNQDGMYSKLFKSQFEAVN